MIKVHPNKSILQLTAMILTITGIFVASNIYTLIPIYISISDSLGVTENQVVIAGSLFTLFYAFGLLSFGPASDIFGRRRILVLGMFVSALSTLAVGFSDTLMSLYVSRSIQGITLGSFAPVAFAYAFDLYSPKNRTLLLVFINTGFLMAGIIGQLISSSINIYYPWEYVFYFFSLCYISLFVISYFVLPKTARPQKNKTSLLKIFIRLLKNRSLIKCYGIAVTLLLSFVALYDGIGRFFTGSEEELFVLRAVGLIGATLSLFTGRLIEKFGVGVTLKTGLMIGGVSLSFMTIFKDWISLMALSVLFVASISLLIPTVITLIGTLGGNHRAKALSLYSFILLAGASLASPIAVALNFNHLLFLLICFFFFNLLSSYLLGKEIDL
ncbi:MFS transporter [Cytobacillus sp. FJAT-54145]|uniref:MFS transporter n=1 Tax=Cytobacillus spartinae TaxID=3299023 RepID=A0ABW6K981_9BACI